MHCESRVISLCLWGYKLLSIKQLCDRLANLKAACVDVSACQTRPGSSLYIKEWKPIESHKNCASTMQSQYSLRYMQAIWT